MTKKSNKIISPASLDEFCKQLHNSLNTIVFTNGCFDLLHPGHIIFLAEAKKIGDTLIVGLNSDDSVTKLKGPDRPINKMDDRAIMLSALESVDYIIGFEEDIPLNLIKKTKA